jgi:hypothetical protein
MHVRNDTRGTRAIILDGDYIWVEPGATVPVPRPADAIIGPGLILVPAPRDPTIEIPPIPEKLAAKVAAPKRDPFDHDGDGKPGGSRKGRASTAAKGARRRRRKKAAPK